MAVPSISGKTLGSNGDDYITVHFQPDGTAEAFDVAQVQLEPGPAATAFDRRGIGQELALCQRYFVEIADTTTNRAIGAAGTFNGNEARCLIPTPVEMRAAPTIGGTLGVRLGAAAYTLTHGLF